MHEIDRLSTSKLKPGALVFDCGAHQAVVALLLASAAGPGGRVIAIEANAHNVRMARENDELNPDGRAPMEIIHAAVAGQDGTVEFSDDLNGQTAHPTNRRSGRVTVPAVTLNTLARRYGPPDVVFLDIEGAEFNALQASDALFADGRRPDWFVEVHAGAGLEELGGSVGSVIEFFRSKNYSLEISANDGEPFHTLETPPHGRFFLIALANENQI